MLLANKSDVINDVVTDGQVKTFMETHGVKLFREVSAKTGNQVLDAFKALGEILMAKSKPKPEGNRVSLSQSKGEISHPDNPTGGK